MWLQCHAERRKLKNKRRLMTWSKVKMRIFVAARGFKNGNVGLSGNRRKKKKRVNKVGVASEEPESDAEGERLEDFLS
jgi:hypothetical protein